MFIAVYEFEIKPGTETHFRTAWLEVTKSIYRHLGSLGSRLHSTDDPNIWIAYAQWPSKAAWQHAAPIEDTLYQHHRQLMQSCLVSSKTVYQLHNVSDFLQADACQQSVPEGTC